MMVGAMTVGALLMALSLFKKRNKMFTEKDFKTAIKVVRRKYGEAIAANVERIYRLETNNFQSKQYKLTGSAGMEAHSSKYPWGWSRGKVWPAHKPTSIVEMRENTTLIKKPFLKFKNVTDAALTLADFLRRYNNNAGRWFSTITSKQDSYINALAKVPVVYA